MKKIIVTIALILLVAVPTLAATTDFEANNNITVTGVTFGNTTAELLIISGSKAVSWAFNSGAFTVIDPNSTASFMVGSADSSVGSIKATNSGGTAVACSSNTTPGTSYVTLPTGADTYTIAPISSSDCTTLCTSSTGVATYNQFPGCGAATCSSGYSLSGSGANAVCNLSGGGSPGGGGGGVAAPTAPSTPAPTVRAESSLITYANNPKVYVLEGGQKRWIQTAENFVKLGYKWGNIIVIPSTETYPDGAVKTTTVIILTKILQKGSQDAEVLLLQQKLKDLGYFPANVAIVKNFGPTTEKAVKAFQQAKGLSPTGIVDAQTRNLLNK